MPAAQQQIFQRRKARENRDTQQGQQSQGGEGGGNFQPVGGFGDPPGQTGGGSRPGGKFRRHFADQGNDTAGLHPGQQIRQGGRQLHSPQDLPARSVIEPRQIDQMEIGRFKSQRCGRQNGKEGDQACHQRQGQIDPLKPHPDQKQRGDGDD